MFRKLMAPCSKPSTAFVRVHLLPLLLGLCGSGPGMSSCGAGRMLSSGFGDPATCNSYMNCRTLVEQKSSASAAA